MSRLKLSFGTKTPPQWDKFIQEFPGQDNPGNSPHSFTRTDVRWRLMCAVQREINTIVQYKHDEEGSDHWKLVLDRDATKPGALEGDCEDFGLTKRALLIAAGFPMGALWPVVCTKGDVGHMVLVVITKDVDYVLDLPGGLDWVHDVTDSKLKWLSAYDGHSWRLAALV